MPQEKQSRTTDCTSAARFAAALLFVCLLLAQTASAATKQQRRAAPARATAAIYQQFRGPNGYVIRWVSDQMPLKVYVAPGTCLDSMIDPATAAPYTSVDARDSWPDFIAKVIEQPNVLASMPQAQGYVPQHYDAALAGIRSWTNYANGSYNYQIVQDPSDADIYVFWTNHFVNKLGLALFENDIRGYTAKRSFPYHLVQEGHGGQIAFRPVVTLLRCVDGAGNPMQLQNMQAAAAHEFGHALGIEGHSLNRNDLMSVFYGHGVISPNDAATVRYLYSLNPDFIP